MAFPRGESMPQKWGRGAPTSRRRLERGDIRNRLNRCTAGAARGNRYPLVTTFTVWQPSWVLPVPAPMFTPVTQTVWVPTAAVTLAE